MTNKSKNLSNVWESIDVTHEIYSEINRFYKTYTNRDVIIQELRKRIESESKKSIQKCVMWLSEYELYCGIDAFAEEYENILEPHYKIKSQGMTFGLNSQAEFNVGKKFDLTAFKDKFIGQRCFIIGNGPSLNKIDMTLLKDEVTFGVNAIYLNEEKMGFLPTFYVVEDTHVAIDRKTEIDSLASSCRFFGYYFKDKLNDASNIQWLNIIPNYKAYESFPHFSVDSSRRIWVGGTVSYINLQLAYYMGFSEVYLIGFDHSYVIPDSADVKGNDITSTTEDVNHFHPDYFGKGYKWHVPMTERMELCYIKTKHAYELAGKKIYNSTAGGRLEVFDRKEYNSVFTSGTPATVNGVLANDWVKRVMAGRLHEHIAPKKDVRCPDVSIIVPVYNVEKYLRECLESLLHQDHESVEIIVVDDGSTDSSFELMEEYANKDPRVRTVRQRNMGLSGARNTGLRHARGHFVMFVDSDDYISKSCLGKMHKNAVVEGNDIVVAEVMRVWDNGKQEKALSQRKTYTGKGFFRKIISVEAPSAITRLLIKRSLFEKANFSFPLNRLHEDVSSTFKVFYYCDKIGYVDEVLYYWRVRAGSITSSVDKKRIADMLKGVDAQLEFLQQENIVADYKDEILNHYFMRAKGLVNNINKASLSKSEKEALEQYLVELISKKSFFVGTERYNNLMNLFNIKTDSIVKMETNTQWKYSNARDNDTIMIIANGPSTKALAEYGFENIPSHIDTFGMGLAYKYYERINWWPTFYGCMDQKVVKNNESEFVRIINSKNTTTEAFFFPYEICNSNKVRSYPHSSTGDFCCRQAVRLGYKNIILIGVDLSYEPLKEARRITREEFDELGLSFNYYENIVWKIETEVKSNPNYFFDDYQSVGDIYSEPQADSSHRMGWLRIRHLLEEHNLYVANCSALSRMDFFVQSDIATEFEKTKASPKPVFNPINYPDEVAVISRDKNNTLKKIAAQCEFLQNKVDTLENTLQDKGRAYTAFPDLSCTKTTPASMSSLPSPKPVCLGGIQQTPPPKALPTLALFFKHVAHIAVDSLLGLTGVGLVAVFSPLLAMIWLPEYAFVLGGVSIAFLVALLGLFIVSFSNSMLHNAVMDVEKRCLGISNSMIGQFEGNFSLLRKLLNEQVDLFAEMQEGLVFCDQSVKDLFEKYLNLKFRIEKCGEINLEKSKGHSENSTGAKALMEQLDEAKSDLERYADQLNALSSVCGKQHEQLSDLKRQFSVSSFSNDHLLQGRERGVTLTDFEEIRQQWAMPLNVHLSDSELTQLAVDICQLESMSEGRFEASTQDFLIRAIVIRSIASKNINILKIGSDYGIHLSALHRACRGRNCAITSTVIDPFEDSFGVRELERISGKMITKKVFASNVKLADISEEAIRVVKDFSRTPEVVDLLRDKVFDVLIIDGEHTYAGLANDVEKYSSVLRAGGYVIFAQYNTPRWPQVDQYIDMKMRTSNSFQLLAQGWSTAVFMKV